MSTMHAPVPRFTEATRTANEIDFFENGGMTDAELAQYARRTAKRPLVCFVTLVASPFIAEGLCRIFGAW